MQWIWVNWWIQMSPNVPSTRQKSGKERVREKVKRKESRFSFFCRRLQLLTRFDWYGIRSYSIKQRFTLHRFLLKNLKASKLFIDVCSNLHLAKVDWCCVCVCVCVGGGEGFGGGWLVLPQRLEELVFHVHLFTCPSSLMGLSREGWIGLKVATRQWNCIAVAQRARASNKIPMLSFLFQLLLSPIREENARTCTHTVIHRRTNYQVRKHTLTWAIT